MGQPTQHHRFRFASAVVSVSVRGAAAPRTGAGELHSQLLRKDGGMSAVALGVGLASLAHRAGIPVRPLWVFSRYGHPLRGPSGLHKAAF